MSPNVKGREAGDLALPRAERVVPGVKHGISTGHAVSHDVGSSQASTHESISVFPVLPQPSVSNSWLKQGLRSLFDDLETGHHNLPSPGRRTGTEAFEEILLGPLTSVRTGAEMISAILGSERSQDPNAWIGSKLGSYETVIPSRESALHPVSKKTRGSIGHTFGFNRRLDVFSSKDVIEPLGYALDSTAPRYSGD